MKHKNIYPNTTDKQFISAVVWILGSEGIETCMITHIVSQQLSPLKLDTLLIGKCPTFSAPVMPQQFLYRQNKLKIYLVQI